MNDALAFPCPNLFFNSTSQCHTFVFGISSLIHLAPGMLTAMPVMACCGSGLPFSFSTSSSQQNQTRSPTCSLWAAVTKRTKCSMWGETFCSHSVLLALVSLVLKDGSVLVCCLAPDFGVAPAYFTLVCQCACKVDSLALSCEEAKDSRSSGGISFAIHCWDFPSCGSGAMGSPSSSKNRKSSSTTRKSVSSGCLSSSM